MYNSSLQQPWGLRRVVLASVLIICAVTVAVTFMLLGRAHGLQGAKPILRALFNAPAPVTTLCSSKAADFAAPISVPWAIAAAAGCDVSALMGDAEAQLSITWHAPPGMFALFAYGPQEYVTRFSQPGSATFFEQHVSDFLIRALHAVASRRPGPAWFLDIGANIGVHTGAVATAGFPVLSVEGFPTTSARLECSRRLNKWSRVAVAPVAISLESRTVCFAVRDKDNQGMNWLNKDSLTDCPPKQLVQASSLSDIVERFAPEHKIAPAIVKLDIEGSELVCLQSFRRHFDGMQRPLKNVSDHLRSGDEEPRRPWKPELFLVELRPQLLAAHAATIPDIIAFVASYGYQTFFADGSRQFSTFVNTADADAEGTFNAMTFNTSTCPNFVLVREDTILSRDEMFHADGCNVFID